MKQTAITALAIAIGFAICYFLFKPSQQINFDKKYDSLHSVIRLKELERYALEVRTKKNDEQIQSEKQRTIIQEQRALKAEAKLKVLESGYRSLPKDTTKVYFEAALAKCDSALIQADTLITELKNSVFDYKGDIRLLEEGIAQRDSVNSILKDENKAFNRVDSLHQVERKSWKSATRKKVFKGIVGGTLLGIIAVLIL